MRVLVGLRKILSSHPSPPPENELQAYLHMGKTDRILDGHRLFMASMPANNPLLSFRSLLDAPRCQCLPRTVFCGYDIKSKTAANDSDRPLFVLTSTRGSIGPKIDIERDYAELRRYVKEELLDKNPLMLQMIDDYRAATFQAHKITNSDGWNLVGLCQRNSRRRWLNLKSIIRHCNQKFRRHKIICLEVNMDLESSHTAQQAVLHGALNGGLIGIHGSHLVNANLLPLGAHVLELLPWFPGFMKWGRSWARKSKTHTPLGSMFHNSDLNHFGFALERRSAPLCKEYIGSKNDTTCLQDLYDDDMQKVWWGNRDFYVDPVIVETFLSRFLVDPPLACDEFWARQQMKLTVDGREKAFVLYNVVCRENLNGSSSAHHYYLDEDEE